MARLSEQPGPAESHLEILRRKFLRQNRDIAKINSDQSQKIRRLENDCARLLSENLDLRGQILRLEKQVEDSSARRIADHALEVKAKLELQLSEFATLLGSLGVEPPAKRRSSDERVLAKPRSSMARSPTHRRRRDTAVDPDMLAELEGRLPPIYENKTFQRATMNSEEILALCAAAADTSDSPDLGPPPVSRYVDEDPVKNASPVRTAVLESPRSTLKLSPPLKLDYDRKPSSSPEPQKEPEDSDAKHATPSKGTTLATQAQPEAKQVVRVGAKRKYGDENDAVPIALVQKGKENVVAADKALSARGGHKRRSTKELSGNKREKGSARTPLSAKSTNEAVSSPRKAMKPELVKAKKEPPQVPASSVVKEEARVQKPLPRVEIPAPEPPATVAVMLESASALPSGMPSSPTTPNRAAVQEMPHDTPPPADISSTGETSRPSRRARASISYAEPNLRDKMRRPTKELFDAVTGEGKFAHRASAATKSEDHRLAPTSSGKIRLDQASSAGGSTSKVHSAGNPTPKDQQQALLSPLAQKDAFAGALPSSVVMERRKRSSIVASSQESLPALESITVDQPLASTDVPSGSNNTNSNVTTTEPEPDHSRHQPPVAPPSEVDVYDFAASSPASTTSKTAVTAVPTTNTTMTTSSSTAPASRPRTARKSSMAAAAALRNLLDEEERDIPKARHVAPQRSRKRASMLAPKKSSMLLESMDEDGAAVVEEAADVSGSSFGSVDGEGQGGGGGGTARDRDRIARRRSMML